MLYLRSFTKLLKSGLSGRFLSWLFDGGGIYGCINDSNDDDDDSND